MFTFLKGDLLEPAQLVMIFAHAVRKRDTILYPEVKPYLPPRYRGRIVLTRDPDGEERCVACNLCASACPVGCISLQKGEKQDGRWYPEFFRINFSRCIFLRPVRGGLPDQRDPAHAGFRARRVRPAEPRVRKGASADQRHRQGARIQLLSRRRPRHRRKAKRRGGPRGAAGGRQRPDALTRGNPPGACKQHFISKRPWPSSPPCSPLPTTTRCTRCLYLIVSLLAVAMVFFSLGAPFAGILEVIVYAGAIMVLFVFVVMLLNLGKATADQERRWLRPRTWIGPGLLSLALLGELARVLLLGGYTVQYDRPNDRRGGPNHRRDPGRRGAVRAVFPGGGTGLHVAARRAGRGLASGEARMNAATLQFSLLLAGILFSLGPARHSGPAQICCSCSCPSRS
jgi:ferredoxin